MEYLRDKRNRNGITFVREKTEERKIKRKCNGLFEIMGSITSVHLLCSLPLHIPYLHLFLYIFLTNLAFLIHSIMKLFVVGKIFHDVETLPYKICLG